MCHFVTLIAPTDDATAVDAVMRTHGRCAELLDNASVAACLEAGEHHYVTTGHCDCGTVLGARHGPSAADFEAELERDAARLRRKRWSEAKIARAIEDRRKTAGKSTGGIDSLELWAEIVRDLRARLGLRHVGLLVHLYGGTIAGERFAVTRRRADPGAPLLEQLASMTNDELTIFA